MKYPVFFFLILLTFTSCKNRQQKMEEEVNLKASEVLRKAKETRSNFYRISMRGKGDFDSPDQSLGFTYKINMLRDSVVWASIVKFGYEGLRILAESDTVRMKITDQKKISICDYSVLRDVAGMDFEIGLLQQILTGTVPYIGDSLRYHNKTDNTYLFKSSLSGNEISYYIDGADYRLKKLHVEEKSGNITTTIFYADFQGEGKQIFPQTVRMEVRNPELSSLVLNHGRFDVNSDEKRYPFRMPDSYEIDYCRFQGK